MSPILQQNRRRKWRPLHVTVERMRGLLVREYDGMETQGCMVLRKDVNFRLVLRPAVACHTFGFLRSFQAWLRQSTGLVWVYSTLALLDTDVTVFHVAISYGVDVR